MYISKCLLDGLRILGFDRETIKSVSRERSLEEIFLTTLFLNYLIIMVIYVYSVMTGGLSIEGRPVNMSVFFGLLMIYPFAYNVIVYAIYGFYGLMAEMLNKKYHVKPLIATGFHTAVVYSILVYIIGLFSTVSIEFGAFLLTFFMIYFVLAMFRSISIIYNYSRAQTLIIVFLPLLLLGIAIMFIQIAFPNFFMGIINKLFL